MANRVVDTSTANLVDWWLAAKSVGSEQTDPTVGPTSIKWTNQDSKSYEVDSNAIVAWSNTEFFPEDRPSTFEINKKGKRTRYIRAEPTVVAAFRSQYAVLKGAENSSPLEAQRKWLEANTALEGLQKVAAASKLTAGQVSFGVPLVSTAREMKLVLPSSVKVNSDVYGIQFAVSFRDLDLSGVTQLSFGVSGPSEAIALQLIPLRYDSSADVKRTISSPELKAKYGPYAIELGKVYEQEIVYKSLRPKIAASGLQENRFSWSLLDDAIQSGTQTFIVVIRVPKGKKSLTLQLQASAKINGLFQGDVVSTELAIVDIALPH